MAGVGGQRGQAWPRPGTADGAGRRESRQRPLWPARDDSAPPGRKPQGQSVGGSSKQPQQLAAAALPQTGCHGPRASGRKQGPAGTVRQDVRGRQRAPQNTRLRRRRVRRAAAAREAAPGTRAGRHPLARQPARPTGHRADRPVRYRRSPQAVPSAAGGPGRDRSRRRRGGRCHRRADPLREGRRRRARPMMPSPAASRSIPSRQTGRSGPARDGDDAQPPATGSRSGRSRSAGTGLGNDQVGVGSCAGASTAGSAPGTRSDRHQAAPRGHGSPILLRVADP